MSIRKIIAAVLMCATSACVAHASSSSTELYYLNLRGQVVHARTSDAAPATLIDKESVGRGPDGIALDLEHGYIYWTTMGKPSADDGTVMRANLDGSNVTTIVPEGGTFTPKQLKLDVKHQKLYWSDREGMRVMRANVDGSNVETLIVTGNGEEDRKDASHWCVGIAIDSERGKLYWTQKGADNAGLGTIKRMNLEMPAGQDAAHRTDVEVLFSGLPEPIDLELDLQHRLLYWTDRGDNTVSRAPLDAAPRDPATRKDRHILVRGLHEAIGIALDVRHDRMYYTSLGGEVGAARLDGKGARLLFKDQGPLTGIAVRN